MAREDQRERGEEQLLLRLFFEEVFQIFFTNPVDAAKFNAFELLSFDELQYRKVVKPQDSRNLFRRQ